MKNDPYRVSASVQVYEQEGYNDIVYLTDDDKDGILEGIVDIQNAKKGLLFSILNDTIYLSDRWNDYDPKSGKTYDSGVPFEITESYSDGDHIRFRVFLDTTRNHPKSVADGYVSGSKPNRNYYYGGYDNFTVAGATPAPTPTPAPAPTTSSTYSFSFSAGSDTVATSNPGIVRQYDITMDLTVSDIKLFTNEFVPDENDSDSVLVQMIKWAKANNVDISSQIYKTASDITPNGQEQSEDMIFVGDPDDLMNAYIPQGTLTLKYKRTDKYMILSPGEKPDPDWELVDGEAILSGAAP